MIGPLALVIIIIALIAAILYFFVWNILWVILNFALIYLIAMRIYLLFKQKRNLWHYLIGFAVGLFFVYVLGFLPFWKLTTLLVVTVVVAEGGLWIVSRFKKTEGRR